MKSVLTIFCRLPYSLFSIGPVEFILSRSPSTISFSSKTELFAEINCCKFDRLVLSFFDGNNGYVIALLVANSGKQDVKNYIPLLLATIVLTFLKQSN